MNSYYFWDEMAAKNLKSNHYQEAIQAYKHALESTTDGADQASVWANIGNIYLILQNVPAAVDAFLAAARLDPSSYDFDCIIERITTNGYLDEPAMVMAKDMYALESVKTSLEAETEIEVGVDQSAAEALVAETDNAPAGEIVMVEPLALIELSEIVAETDSTEPASSEASDLVMTEATVEEVPAEVEVVETPVSSEAPEMDADPAIPEPVAEETNPEFEAAEPIAATETSPSEAEVAEVEAAFEPEPVSVYTLIPVAELVENPLRLRASMQSEDLVESVRQHGILQPLVVTRLTDGKYMVVTGNRRLEAARLVGLENVPAIVRSANERELLELALIENIQRINLNSLELAEAYQLLAENFGMSLESIAATVGKSSAVVTATISLLKLTEEGKQALLEKSISEGHARALVTIDLPALQNNALVYILENRLGVRQTEDLVRIILNAVAVSQSYAEPYHAEDWDAASQPESEPIEAAVEVELEIQETELVVEMELPLVEIETAIEMVSESEVAQSLDQDALSNPEPVLEETAGAVEIVIEPEATQSLDQVMISDPESVFEATASAVEVDLDLDALSTGEQVVIPVVTADEVIDFLMAVSRQSETSVEKHANEQMAEQSDNQAAEADETFDFSWILREAETKNQIQEVGMDLPASSEALEEEILEKTATLLTSAVETTFAAANSAAAPDLAIQTEVSVENSVFSPVLEDALQTKDENLEAVIEEIVQFTSDGDSPLGETQPEASQAQPSAMPEAAAVLSVPETASQKPEGPEVRTQLKGLEAIAVYRRVVENNPANVRIWHLLGNLYSEIGQYDEAIECLKRTIELEPGKYTNYYHLGLTLATARRYTDAILALEKTIELTPQHILAHCSLAGCYRQIGQEAEAQMHIEIARPKLVNEKAYNRACFESIAGNTDQAIELLQIAITTDNTPLEWLLRDPDLGFIRDDLRFQALIAALNLPA